MKGQPQLGEEELPVVGYVVNMACEVQLQLIIIYEILVVMDTEYEKYWQRNRVSTGEHSLAKLFHVNACTAPISTVFCCK